MKWVSGVWYVSVVCFLFRFLYHRHSTPEHKHIHKQEEEDRGGRRRKKTQIFSRIRKMGRTKGKMREHLELMLSWMPVLKMYAKSFCRSISATIYCNGYSFRVRSTSYFYHFIRCQLCTYCFALFDTENTPIYYPQRTLRYGMDEDSQRRDSFVSVLRSFYCSHRCSCCCC